MIPNADHAECGGNIRKHVLDMAHQGHPGITAMKGQLRSRVWFPKMDEAVKELVNGCLACQAKRPQRDPLIPTTPPKQPWEVLGADHWGPTPDGNHILVVIVMLTKYPEEAVMKNTSMDANIEALDDIMSRHGYFQRLRTDNGPSWSGRY